MKIYTIFHSHLDSVTRCYEIPSFLAISHPVFFYMLHVTRHKTQFSCTVKQGITHWPPNQC